MGDLSTVAQSMSTLGAWITLGLGVAFGSLFLLWGHALGKAASVALGALCGLLLGTLVGVATGIISGQSAPMFALAGGVLGALCGAIAGWFLVRTTMVTIMGTIVGSIAASVTWTATAPAKPFEMPKLVGLPQFKSAGPTTHDETPKAEHESTKPPLAAATEPTPPKNLPDKTAKAKPVAKAPAAAAPPQRVVVGKTPTENKTLDTKVVDDHGRKRIVIRSKTEVEAAQGGSLSQGISALAKVSGKDEAGGPDLGALLNMAKGGQADPAQLQNMLSQLQGGGGGLGSLAGMPGMSGMPGMGSMGDLAGLEGQLGSAAAALGDIVRRIVLSGLVGLVVSTLASVGAAFIKKPLVPLTMSLTGAYCVAGAVEAGLSLTSAAVPAMMLHGITIALVVAGCVFGTRYQLKAIAAPRKPKKDKNEGEPKAPFSPLARVGPSTGVVTSPAASNAGEKAIDPLGPAPVKAAPVKKAG